MRYLVNEALLRLIKPGIALLMGLLLYWLLTGPVGEPGSAVLGLACWISAAVLIQLLETGVI
jgi:hypothetical protein